MRNTDIAWAAGFIDGEGSILIRQFNTRLPKYGLSVQVTQETREPLDKLVTIFGGIVRHQKSYNKKYYRYIIYARKASIALELMLPYLTVKRIQAELVVKEFTPLVPTVGKRYTDDVRDKMGLLYNRIREIRREAKVNA